MKRVGLFSKTHLILAALLGSAGVDAVAQQGSGDLLQYPTADGTTKPIKTTEAWQNRSAEITENIAKVTGPLPDDTRGLPAPLVVFKDTMANDVFVRYRLHIRSYPGEVVPALLYIPRKAEPRAVAPAVLALHGTGAKGKWLVDSSEAGPNRATATELAYRGYIVLAPDYPGFGELSEHDFAADRFESGVMQAVFNNMRCIDYLQSRPDVDKDRIGAIGHSLGGHTAMFLAAFDQRVKMVVSSCGWTPFEYYNAGKAVTERFGSKLGPWAQDRYMPLVRERFQSDPAQLPFNFDELIATLAPRYFFSNSPLHDANFNVEGVRKGIAGARAVYALYGASDHLEVHYPNAGHDFPIEIRQLAYRKMDEVFQYDKN